MGKPKSNQKREPTAPANSARATGGGRQKPAPAAPQPTAGRPSSTVTDQLERELLQSAYHKRQHKQPLSRAEVSAVKRFEAKQEEDRRWEYYQRIPKRHWVEMSGRQHKQLQDVSRNYGFPLDQAEINLPQFVQFFHEFLAQNGHKLLADPDGDLEQAGDASPMLERLREEKWKLARLDRQERQKHLLPRAQVRDSLARMVSVMRSAGEILQRQFGAEAADVLNSCLQDLDRQLAEEFTAKTKPVIEQP